MTFSNGVSSIIYATTSVNVCWNPKNKNHYTNLGYDFTFFGDVFDIPPCDLPNGSNLKISVVCPRCLNIRSAYAYHFRKTGHSYCHACLMYLKNFKDITGQKFNKLTVVSFNEVRGRRYYWNCICDCGNKTITRSDGLKSGRIKSCGCLRSELTTVKDRLGIRYGKLIAIELTDRSSFAGSRYWKCACDCGNEVIVAGNLLSVGDTRSCGCLRKENAQKRGHDLSGQQLNRWKVLNRDNARDVPHTTFWKCVCACGTKRSVRTMALILGRSKSCGCYRLEITKAMSGEKNPNWNPDLTAAERKRTRSERGYYTWKNNILKRDNFLCVINNCFRGNLEAHHLYGYSEYAEFRTYVPNGVTLCSHHHRLSTNSFHSIYGKKNCTGLEFFEWVNSANTLK